MSKSCVCLVRMNPYYSIVLHSLLKVDCNLLSGGLELLIDEALAFPTYKPHQSKSQLFNSSLCFAFPY